MENQIVHTIGRRKSSVARIYLKKGKGDINIIENKIKAKKEKRKTKIIDYKIYFSHPTLIYKIQNIFVITNYLNKYDVNIKVSGGGLSGQVGAIQLAISRAFCILDSKNRKILKPLGLLMRDSRVVERKKYGQKKARKNFQFSKR